MLGVAGIFHQKPTGKIFAAAAVSVSPGLTANRNGTLPVERAAVGLNTAAAVKRLFVFAPGAVQSAS